MKGPAGAIPATAVPTFAGEVRIRTGEPTVSNGSEAIAASSQSGNRIWVHGRLMGVTPREVLTRYESGGLDALAELDGHAVLAISDAEGDTFHLVRHPGPEITVFYRRDGDVIRWSTRAADLVAQGDTFDSDTALLFLRSGAVLSPRTMVNEVRRIPPHQALSVSGGKVDTATVWRPVWPRDESLRSMSARVERLDEVMRASVSAHLQHGSANPAILMSGGIDSAGLAAAIVRLAPDLDLTAYTLTFEGDHGSIDEFDEAHAVAAHLGIKHEPIPFDHRLISDHLDWMLATYGEPFGYGLHTAYLGPIKSNGHTVVFGGTGPDAFYPEGSQRRWQRLGDLTPPGLRPWVARTAASFDRMPGAPGLAKAFDLYSMSIEHRMTVTPGPKSDDSTLIEMGVPSDALSNAVTLGEAYIHSRLVELPDLDLAQQAGYSWACLVFPDQGAEWMHRWAAAYGLETSLPLFDRAVSDVVMQIPHLGADRAEFREVALQSLPHDLAYNRKIGQTLPLAAWMRGPLLPFVRERLSEVRCLDGLVDQGGVETLVNEHVSGASHHWLLWKLLALVEWKMSSGL